MTVVRDVIQSSCCELMVVLSLLNKVEPPPPLPQREPRAFRVGN